MKRTGSSTTNYNITPGRVPLNATPSNGLFHAKFAVSSSCYSMDRRQCLAAYMQLEAAAQSIRAAQALSLAAISSFNARNSISPTTSLPRPLPLFSSHPYQLQSPQLMLSLALYSPSHINLTAPQHHHRFTLPQRLAHRLPASCLLFKPRSDQTSHQILPRDSAQHRSLLSSPPNLRDHFCNLPQPPSAAVSHSENDYFLVPPCGCLPSLLARKTFCCWRLFGAGRREAQRRRLGVGVQAVW